MAKRHARPRATSESDAQLSTVVLPAVRTSRSRPSPRAAGRDSPQAIRRADRCSTPVSHFRYYVDIEGRQHFNFLQQVWLRPHVEMAVTAVMTVALETLAINLLTQVTRERDYAAAVGMTSHRVMQLARDFCSECLLTAHRSGWVIPRSTVKSWLAARIRCEHQAQPPGH